MMLDGYGDQVTPEAVEQLLREEEEFFVRNARAALVKREGRGFPEGADDDAVQEARIAAWQSWVKDQNSAYMNIAVKQRLIQHVFREQWFGTKPTSTSGGMDPIRRRDRDSLDDPDIDVVLEAAQNVDRVILAYHYGQIAEAINALTPIQRQYVVLRFWHGMTNPEIAAELGKTSGYMGTIWTTVRPALKETLAHLDGVLL